VKQNVQDKKERCIKGRGIRPIAQKRSTSTKKPKKERRDKKLKMNDEEEVIGKVHLRAKIVSRAQNYHR